MPGAPLIANDSTRAVLPDGRELLSFGGCNYLALANHPKVIEAVQRAHARFGLSSSASRETTGNTAPHDALEAELANFLGVEAVVLTPDGYIANIAACQSLREICQTAALDDRAHESLADAARTAGMTEVRFAHRDADGLRRIVGSAGPGAVLAMTDGVFTADGEPADLLALSDALGERGVLLVDDCHGLGVLGAGGRGSANQAGLSGPRVVTTSSLAKGLGCAGGLIAGSRDIADRARAATAYVCTTPIAPAMAEGTRAALAVLRAEPGRLEALADNARHLRRGLVELGLISATKSRRTPVVAFTVGTGQQMERIASGLEARGLRVPLIAYPGGPADSYFRVSVNAAHTAAQIDTLLDALAAVVDRPLGVATAARDQAKLTG